jgi:uncharacterized protein (DUF302 family)
MYGFSIEVPEPFDRVLERTTQALEREGFGILTVIDVRATFRRKLGVEILPYQILGACNPQLAHEALSADPEIGLLLPCNVVVREIRPTCTRVSFMDPEAVLGLTENASIPALAGNVRKRLLRVRKSLERTREPD